MDELNANISRIIDCLQEINRSIADLNGSVTGTGRKRPRRALCSESGSETESDLEPPQETRNVSENAPEADEDGARSCIKTHYDTPVVVVDETPNGARKYQTLPGTRAKKETRSSAKGVIDVCYNRGAPLQDEDDLPEGEILRDTEFVDDGTRRGFLNPVSNRVFRIVPLCQERDYGPIKRVFLAPTPEAPDFIEKKHAVLLGLQAMGADLAFGTASNKAASDEMHHMLIVDAPCHRSKRLPAVKNGFLCDACNLRRRITHSWDDGINLGRNCAEKVDFISDALRLVPRTSDDICKHGEALFARFIVHAESLLSPQLAFN